MRLAKTDFNLNEKDLTPLPYSEDVEMCVLECILNQPDIFYPIALKFLKPKGMFYAHLNAELWDTMQKVSKDGGMYLEKVKGVIDGLRDKEKLNHFLKLIPLINF